MVHFDGHVEDKTGNQLLRTLERFQLNLFRWVEWSIIDPIQDLTLEVDWFGASRPSSRRWLRFRCRPHVTHYLVRIFDSSALVKPFIESGMSGGAEQLAYNIKYLILATTAACKG
jgi:hypothetical protein